MAIFSKKENNDEVVETTATTVVEATPIAADDNVVTESTPTSINLEIPASRNLVVPRLSEKAGKMDRLNKYVFTVWGKANKVEVRKIVEKQYGVKVDRVNMIVMGGRTRRFGRNMGLTKAYKKAIVTLTATSKKIDLVEPT